MARFAWVTLATNDSYSLGALVLAHSLRRVNTAHQLVVLITPSVSEAMKTQLSAVFNVVKVVDVLDSKDADNLALLARPELGITFTKLHCWRLTEFDKCVFLDADTLVLQNSDELFDRDEFSAAPDAGWPDCFNSGVFVYKPSNDTFKSLIDFALIHGSFDGGDQGLLNLFFNEWATKDISKHLSFVYNMCSTATYSYLPAFKRFGSGLKIIHFIGAAKPWLQPFNTETSLVQVAGESQHIHQFVQFWWDLFCTHVHPSLNSEMAGLAGALSTLTLGAPLSVEQSALEEHLRRQGWEQGNIDYLGKDSFANIWKKISETLSGSLQPLPADLPTDAPPAGPIEPSPSDSSETVSASKSTVVASGTEAASVAAPAETSTVTSQPKPSVTEITSTEVAPPAEISAPVIAQVSVTKQAEDSQPLVLPATLSSIELTKESVPQEKSTKETKTPPTTPVNETAPTLQTTALVNIPLEDKSDPVKDLTTNDTKVVNTQVSGADTGADSAKNVVEIQTLPPAPISSLTKIDDGIFSIQGVKQIEAPLEAIPSKVDAPVGNVIKPEDGAVKVEQTQPLSSDSSSVPKDISLATDNAKDLSVQVASIEVASAEAPVDTQVETSTLTQAQGTAAQLEPITSQPSLEPIPPPAIVPSIETTTTSTGVESKSIEPLTPTIAQIIPSSPTPPTTAEPIPPPPQATEEKPAPLQPTSPTTTEPIKSPPSSTPQATETEVKSAPVQVTSPTTTEPISSPPTSTPQPTEAEVKSAPVEPAAPLTTEPVQSPPTSTPQVTETETKSVPILPITTPTTQPVPPTSLPEATEVEVKSAPIQPDTPTITEPTPPTSPSAAAPETPLATSLQVGSETPSIPAVEAGATSAPASSEEPPVPPKRKGGSKASPDSKTSKGGKQPKGKK